MSAQPYAVQGSEEWLQWRRTRGGASELPALMGCSPWFPKTPLQLFQLKTGQAEVYENSSMRRGTELEFAAREYLEEVLDEVFEPQVVETGRLIASLDGQSFDRKTVLEIKIPAAGLHSDTWQHLDQHKKPPIHYWWQCQQQLLVSGAERCLFIVCEADDENDIIGYISCTVLPDPAAHEAIRDAWADFFQYLDADQPPPMTERDVIERSDPDWSAAAQAYRMAKAVLKNAESAEKAARERLQALAGEQSTRGCGVSASRFWRAGVIDYKKALPADIDIEQYRKQGNWNWRITESKD